MHHDALADARIVHEHEIGVGRLVELDTHCLLRAWLKHLSASVAAQRIYYSQTLRVSFHYSP